MVNLLDQFVRTRITSYNVCYTKLLRKTGARNAPKLFDERRGVDRKTENLEIRLKRKQGSGAARSGDMIATVISYGEIASAGAYRSLGNLKEKVFVGTVGIIRDITLRRKFV